METIQDQILDYLEKSKYGASGSEMAKDIGKSRITIVKHLEVMRAQGLVEFKQVGMAKVWRIGGGVISAKLLENVLFEILPEKFTENDPENAANLLADTSKEMIVKTFQKNHDAMMWLKEQENFIDQLLFCYALSGIKASKVDFEIMNEDDKSVTIKINICPHFEYVKNNPLACNACRGIKLGILELVYGEEKAIRPIKSMA
ncbi:MAG: hypothetical protein KAH86_10695, partial [Methanosarcinales archaeon]|nr:hypothetical protein [Methanosarcinales archaeon]